MTLKQLEVFLAVADSSSFSKGGESVSLAQSTASQHIRALEEELGARLFDRTVSQVRLTEVGQLFYRHAAKIRIQCSEAKEEVRRFQGLVQATLRLSASTIPAAYLIPVLLSRFTALWPGVRLELQQGDSREAIRLLQDNHVEMAMVGGQYDMNDVVFTEILTDRIVLVGLPGQQCDGALSVQQLQDMPLVMREQGSGTRKAADEALQRAGLDLRKLKVVAQFGSSEAVRQAVLCGAGAAFVSGLALKRELEEGSLVEIPVADLAITRSFYLAKRKGGSLSPAATALMETLHCHFSRGDWE